MIRGYRILGTKAPLNAFETVRAGGMPGGSPIGFLLRKKRWDEGMTGLRERCIQKYPFSHLTLNIELIYNQLI